MAERKQKTGLLLVLIVSLLAFVFSTGAWLKSPRDQRRVSPPKAADPLRHVLVLNGNHNADLVVFNHEEHKQRQDGERGCGRCHHLHKPRDINTSCCFCHEDMTAETPIFDHDFHGGKLGGNDSCARCHDLDRVKSGKNAAACPGCHAEDMRMSPPPDGQRYNFMAPGYEDAMHGLCLECHREKARETGRPELARCDACHQKVHHEEDELNR